MSGSEVRDANGRFVKGHPGGPGRPRNPVTEAIADLDRLGIEVAQRLIGVIAEQALKGDLKAANMLLQRVWPVRRNRPIEVASADAEGEPYTIDDHRSIASAMFDGEITPQEAQVAARVLKSLQEQMKAVDDTLVGITYARGK
jgi:hypothetical protein